MEIQLCVNNSEVNKINKVLTDSISLQGTLRNETSVVSPEILIEIENPSGFNYAYIPEFGRYYFITDMVSVRNNLWRVLMNVDVLESFKSQILSQNCIIEKSTLGFDLYLPDENLVTLVKTKTDIVNFPSGLLESGEFILITAGG
jgi:hypothetical protein